MAPSAPIRRGIWVDLSNRGGALDPPSLEALAPQLESDGVDLLLLGAARPFSAGGSEPLTALGAIGGRVQLVLGAMVELERGRSPSIVAKLASSLALLHGEGVLVVLADDPAQPDPSAFLEALGVLAALREPGRQSLSGDHFELRDAINEPLAPYLLGAYLPSSSDPGLIEAVALLVEVLLIEGDDWKAALGLVGSTCCVLRVLAGSGPASDGVVLRSQATTMATLVAELAAE